MRRGTDTRPTRTQTRNYIESRTYAVDIYGLHFDLVNATAAGGQSFDASKNVVIVATELVFGGPTPASWLEYRYRWGPAATHSTITPETVHGVLHAVAGVSAYVLDLLGIDPLVAMLVSKFHEDDVNGPEGPKTKTETWAGVYT